MDDARPAPDRRPEAGEPDPAATAAAHLPAYEPDPELRLAVDRESYDEQILAALVSP